MSDCPPIIRVVDEVTGVRVLQESTGLVRMAQEGSPVRIVNDCGTVIRVPSEPTIRLRAGETESRAVKIILEKNRIRFHKQTIINNTFEPGAVPPAAVICQMEAGQAINVNRAVRIRSDGRIEHAESSDPESACDVVGISRQSGAIGQLVEVVKFGKLSGAAFASPGINLFLGSNGQLQTSPPVTGAWLSMGVQLSATEFFVNVQEAIERN